MEYIELKIYVADTEQSEIVMAQLSDYPFEAFEEEQACLKAYIQCSEWEDVAAEISSQLTAQGLEFGAEPVVQQNWNAEWESGFEPVDIATEPPIRIRAAHHEPQQGAVDVVIAPRMSFGTGHHTTTALMSATIASLPIEGKRGLDMGCGTGVLAIVALKCGAKSMVAVDIDDWACDSCRDSIALSGVEQNVDVRVGSTEAVQGEKFDFILANINRNILQSMIPEFAQGLSEKGLVVMSGFLLEDADAVAHSAEQSGMARVSQRAEDGWVVMVCEKL